MTREILIWQPNLSLQCGRELALAVIAFTAIFMLPACGATPESASTPATDASGGGLLFDYDGAIPVCRDAGARPADAATRDAATCTPSRQVSYVADVAPILVGSCVGEICHGGTWGTASAYRYIVDVEAPECCDHRKLVSPGDPDGSYVIQKLRGRDLCAGQPMPLGGHLAETDIATLSDWICEGAPHP